MKRLITVFLLISFTTYAQNSGTLNPNFGNNGTANFVRQSSFLTIDTAMQGDKILVVGYAPNFVVEEGEIVLRFNADGTQDFDFGGNGYISISGSGTSTSKIATFPNGSFVVYSYNEGKPKIIKYSKDGLLDKNFGNNGEFIIDFHAEKLISRVKLLAFPTDNKIVIGVNVQTNVDIEGHLVKITADGHYDKTFGNGNGITNALPPIFFFDKETFNGVGDYIISTPGYNPSLSYVFHTGKINRKFGNNGVLKTQPSPVAIFTNKNEIAIFSYGYVKKYNISKKQYVSDFGNQGVFNFGARYHVSSGYQSIKELSDKTIIHYGSTNQKWKDFGVRKMLPNGNGLDPSFSPDGIVEIDVSGRQDFLTDCFELPNKKLLCVGFSYIDGPSAPVIVKLQSNTKPDPSFAKNGIYIGNPYHKFRNGFIIKVDNNFSKDSPRWVGTSIEPNTNNVCFEFADFNNGKSYLLSNVRTRYKELDINSVLIYSFEPLQNSLNSILMIGSVKNESGNNDFMIARQSNYSRTFAGTDDLVVKTDINNGSNDIAKGAIIQNDNGVRKILVIGESNGNLAMVRYFADGKKEGQLDPSFGNNGILSKQNTKAFAGSFIPNNVKSMQDGTIYICGEETQGNKKKFSLKKFSQKGIEDTSFLAFDESTKSENNASNFEILADGSFIVIGNEENQLKIRKYKNDGTPDVNFGNNSYLLPDVGSSIAKLNDVKVLKDGRIIIVGTLDNKGFVTIFNSEGNLDLSFANKGILKTTFGFNKLELTSVSQKDESNVYISGVSYKDGNSSAFNGELIVNSALSVNEFVKNNVSIYPNPTEEFISIVTNKSLNFEKVLIYDLLGKKVKMIKSNFDNINVSDLSNGVYFLKISTDKGFANKKIIIN